MEDLQELQQTIETLLAGLIGIYTFSGGLVTAAIAIDDGSQPLSATGEVLSNEQPTVTGLEVLIVPGAIDLTNFLDGDKRVDLGTNVVLKQWDISKTTRAAREILVIYLDDVESVAPPQRRSTLLDTIETCTLTLSTSFHSLRSSR